MAIQPGQKLSHYELAEQIGEGGMGVVWRGRDTRLDRDVAIKVLPDDFAQDPDRLARFEREAKLLASLSHGNIATIHGLEHDSGLHFLAMELVEGEDLATRIGRGAIPVEEALPLAQQIASALEAAHERGVIHRDLKPPNIKITPEGKVKVLDFGLAKAFGPDAHDPMTSPTMSPTVTSAGETAVGVILGTAAYMSPEQAKGKPVDRRADIWSFGVVLLEMLTGRLQFRGESVSETIAAVLTAEPDLSGLPANTPPDVRRLIERCLRKDPQSRLRDIGDARVVVEEAIADREWENVPSAQKPTARRRAILPFIVVGVLGAALGIAIWSMVATPDPASDGRVVRFSVDRPAELETWGHQISPKGDLLAYLGRPRENADPNEPEPSRLYVRPIDRMEPRVVEGADGLASFAFSPDGSHVAFRAPMSPRSSRLRLFKAPLDGSAPPLGMLDWSGDWFGNVLWLPNGDLIALTSGYESIVRIPSDGSPPGDPVEIRADFDGVFTFRSSQGSVLPDGVHIVGTTQSYERGKYDLNVAILNVDTGEARVLVRDGSNPMWSSTGPLVFSRADALLALPLDLDTMVPSGAAVAIVDGFRAQAIFGDTWFDLSGDGTLIHWPGGVYGDRRSLVIAGTSPEEPIEPWSDERRYFGEALRVSPGRKWLAVVIVNDAGLFDIWVSDVRRPRLSRLVSQPGQDCAPELWTPDERRLIYACAAVDEEVHYIKEVEGGGEARELWRSSVLVDDEPRTFLPDGRLVLRHHVDGEAHLKLLALDEPGSTPSMFIEKGDHAHVSPDGQWLAYDSHASGRREVYLRPLRNDGSVGGEIPVMPGNAVDGWHVLDGKKLVLRINRSGLYDVWVEGSGQIGEPVQIMTTKEIDESGRDRMLAIEPMRNGTYMIIQQDEDEKRPDRINIVLNWHTELNRR